MRSKITVLVRENTQGQVIQKQMAEHKYGQPMVVGQNLNDAAEDYYVLKLGEWKKKNKLPAVTIYYRSTEYNLHSETYIDEENKVHFVVNYWGECFFFSSCWPQIHYSGSQGHVSSSRLW